MGLLKPASRAAYLKAALSGFEKSGKTHTGMLLALGTRRHFGLTGPVAAYDTEMGSDYWEERVRAETGQDLLVTKSRSLVDLVGTLSECAALNVSVLVVDSVTHVWREVCDAYLAQIQAQARARGGIAPEALSYQDWGPIKAMWARWSDAFVTAPLHIVACGRAGFIYDHEENDRGEQTLVKTGRKMKAEEFGYEASLLVEMTRENDPSGELTNRATVVGDRYDVLNGKSSVRPTFDFFRPFVAKLTPASHAPVDTALKTSFGLDERRHDGWARERVSREILAERIVGAFRLADMDGQSAEAKKAQTIAREKFWGSTSWTEISERTPSEKMLNGLVAFELAHGLRDPESVAALPKTGGGPDDEIGWAPEAKQASSAAAGDAVPATRSVDTALQMALESSDAAGAQSAPEPAAKPRRRKTP